MIIPNGTTLYEMSEAERLRQKAIGDMVNIGSRGGDVTIAQVRIIATRLADAGYRKFEIVEEDV